MGSKAQAVFISRGLFVLFGSAQEETDFASVLASVGTNMFQHPHWYDGKK
jgi:hypothetical protein